MKQLFLYATLLLSTLNNMKTTTSVIIIIILNSISINAQQYSPFPINNAVWRVDWGSASCSATFPSPYDVSNYQYQITGDTIIGGGNYHKINRSGLFYCADPLPSYLSGSAYTGAFRDDSLAKKIYYIPKDSIYESLLYDFNLQTGDTIKGYLEQLAKNRLGSTFFAIIDSVDSVLINVSYRKRWYFHSSNWNDGQIIEGIGCTYGLIEGLLPTFDDNGSLLCHSQNGVTLYGGNQYPLVTSIENVLNNNNFIIYPNPVVQGESISISSIHKDDVNIEIYDVLGKKQFIKVKNDGNKLTIDTSSMIDGVYLIVIKELNQVTNQQKITVLKRK